MDRSRGIIKTVGGRPQFPRPTVALGILPAWSAEINLTVEAIRLQKGVINFQAPNRPLLRGPTDIQEKGIIDIRLEKPSAWRRALLISRLQISSHPPEVSTVSETTCDSRNPQCQRCL